MKFNEQDSKVYKCEMCQKYVNGDDIEFIDVDEVDCVCNDCYNNIMREVYKNEYLYNQ